MSIIKLFIAMIPFIYRLIYVLLRQGKKPGNPISGLFDHQPYSDQSLSGHRPYPRSVPFTFSFKLIELSVILLYFFVIVLNIFAVITIWHKDTSVIC